MVVIIRGAAAGASVAVLAAAMTGCSVDTLIWGPDGAQVIETTELLTRDLSAGEPSEIICDDSVADLGEPTDWAGLSAGEPEHFTGEHWIEKAPLGPQWMINLEGLPDGATGGDTYPGDVFYRGTDDGLCVIDIAWQTLVPPG